MDENEKKVLESAEFYSGKMLGMDFMQIEFAYRSIKPYFKGNFALEIGPSIGYMTKHLVNDFKQLYVVEASEELLNQIPVYKNVVIQCSMIENFQTEEKFDTIIMSHVLEHIEHPVEVMEKIYNWLSPGGVFIVVVPNAKSIHRIVATKMGLLESIYTLNERDHTLGHYRVYDGDSLLRDITSAGFKVTSRGGLFLKPLSNAQIEEYWTSEMVEGFYEAGKEFPDNCSEIFMVASNFKENQILA